ncbi:MAG: hypothetical protein KTR26_10480 [Flammeovirgaceae bacterium]|nr:hypothetical protein [Flammeovirgaceae bacterium]
MAENSQEILKYIQGDFSPTELQAFEERLQKDNDLKRELQMHQEIIEEFENHINKGKGISSLEKVHSERIKSKFFENVEVENSSFSKKNVMKIAASIVLVLSTIFFIYQIPSNEDTLVKNFASEIPKENLSEQINRILEGSGIIANSEALEKLSIGLNHYNKKEFKEAIPNFKFYLSQEENEINASFYLAVSLIQVGNREEGITYLKEIIKHPENTLSGKAAVILAGNYILLKEKDKAQSIVNIYITNPYLEETVLKKLKELHHILED